MGPVRFLAPIRFLACKAEWSARRNLTLVLFWWSHQATDPVWLYTAVHLWFDRIICRTPHGPRATPVWALCGPRTWISNVFLYPTGPAWGPCRTRRGAVQHPYGHVRKLTQPEFAKILHGHRMWPYGLLTVPAQAVHRLFTISKPVRGL